MDSDTMKAWKDFISYFDVEMFGEDNAYWEFVGEWQSLFEEGLVR